MAAKSMDFAMGSHPLPSCFASKSSKVGAFTVRCSSVTHPTGGATIGERPWKVANTRLVLEDGSIWMAKSFGASGTQVGEVVFNTSLTGTEYASDTWKINVFVA